MSFIMTPSGLEGMKKYGWSNRENMMTVGVEFVDGKSCVSYIRPILDDLIHQLAKPVPGAQAHVYKPLASGHARFLRRVQQPSDRNKHEVVFEFVTSSLENGPCPEYTAISYCWGTSPPDSHVIFADGSYIPVTAKAARILARIAVDAEHIWLDAVCINQADDSEKAQQIPLMANIYQSATSVDIWLGKGEGITRVIPGSVKDLDSFISRGANFLIDYDPDRHSPFSPYLPENVVDMIWSPWFERAWVAQEFCFATNLRYHFGDVVLHPLFFDMILRDLKTSWFADDDQGQCQIALPPMIRNFRNFRALRSIIQGTENRNLSSLKTANLNLEDILCTFYGLKATDPRDKVFAMLSFVDPKFRRDITPDYTRHPSDIYHDATESILLWETTFRLIGVAGLAAPRPQFADRPNTPSWVPDLSATMPHVVWAFENRFNSTTPLPANKGVSLKCFHLFEPRRDLVLRGNDNSLKLSNNYEHHRAFIIPHGRRVATITDVLPGDPTQNIANVPGFLAAGLARTSDRDALWKTLVAEDPACLAVNPKGEGFDWLRDLLLSPSTYSRTLPGSIWKDGKTPEACYLQTMLREGTGATRGLFWATCSGTTETESEGEGESKIKKVGLAANGVQPGDEVWLLIGARVPFILRKVGFDCFERGRLESKAKEIMSSDRCYYLVCEAYLNGIMRAETDIERDSQPVLLF
ncbi:Heterokaryon incompatibility protein (HET) domain containing protein [Naviculisporaceae sp. PSN 640]